MNSLGIWIPSWNRARFFNRLISSLQDQRDDVRVVAGLNPPFDGYDIPEWCEVICNETNIGQSRNILQGITALDTDYIWMIGDDEQVLPWGIKEIKERIQSGPGMVICTDDVFDHGPTGDYLNWPEWMDACVEQGREVMLTAQTFMSSTVFRRAGLDMDTAEHYLQTRYGHHFGLLKGLMWEPVTVTREPVFIAGSCRDSSIYQEDSEYLSTHGSVTSAALRELIVFASQLACRTYPETAYRRGHGFDG
jgi:hypothetical protein